MADLSAVYKIGTPERRSYLRASLAAMRDQETAIETIVCVPADADWGDTLPADRLIRVASPALTVARNRGAAVATTDRIAFVDDDAYPDPGWSRAIIQGFDTGADAVGGPLVPDWRGRELTTIPQTWHWLIGCGPYYESSQWVPNTYGSNFAVRQEAFEAVGGFDESIGMGSGGVGQGAETDLARRLRAAGYDAVWYVPNAAMRHVITADRLRTRELLVRAFEQGRAKAALGVGSREWRFIREELAAVPRRPIRETATAGLLVAAVVAGTARQRMQEVLQ